MAINKRDKGDIFSSWLWFKFGWDEDEEDEEWDGRGNDKWDKQMVGWIIDKSKGISHYIFILFIKRELLWNNYDLFSSIKIIIILLV